MRFVISTDQHGQTLRRTFFDICRLGTLLRNWIVHNDILEFGSFEILLARLLLRAVLGCVLIHGLEPIRLAAGSVDTDTIEEFVRLLANFQ